jgi:hypothetical protein
LQLRAAWRRKYTRDTADGGESNACCKWLSKIGGARMVET